MRQQDYQTILSCIQFGAPALATGLIDALNIVVEKANELTELQRKHAEETRKAEIAKAEEAKKIAAEQLSKAKGGTTETAIGSTPDNKG